MVFSLGPTAESMKETMLTTRRKDTVSSTGQMAESMKVDGRMVNNTVLEPTPVLVARPSRENGKMERDSNGSVHDHNFLHFNFSENT
jgi:hypothetical protein